MLRAASCKWGSCVRSVPYASFCHLRSVCSDDETAESSRNLSAVVHLLIGNVVFWPDEIKDAAYESA